MQMNFYRQQVCCICLNQQCFESNDHQKITERGLYCLVQNSARRTEEIQQLKDLIKLAFQKVLNKVISGCQSPQQQKIQTHNLQIAQKSLINLVRKLEFYHILQKFPLLKDIEGYLLGFTLSKRRMIQLVKALKYKSQFNQQSKHDAVQRLRIQLNRFIRNLNVTLKIGINNFAYGYLFERFSIILCQQQRQARKMIKSSKFVGVQQKTAGAIITQSTIFSEGEIGFHKAQYVLQLPYSEQIVFLQNTPMLCDRQILELSFTKMTDKLLYKYIPAIDKFKRIKELSLRNNSLSQTAYLVLLGQHSLLKKLDIRSSNINSSMIPLIKKCCLLEVLYVSQCFIKDYHFLIICQSLALLHTIYCGQNSISYQALTYILENQHNLRNISLVKNQIQFSDFQKFNVQTILNDRNGFFEF